MFQQTLKIVKDNGSFEIILKRAKLERIYPANHEVWKLFLGRPQVTVRAKWLLLEGIGRDKKVEQRACWSIPIPGVAGPVSDTGVQLGVMLLVTHAQIHNG